MVSHNLKQQFRADINFLRAIAVLLVIFFHFHISYFSGGYIGVDVFFVISGYLMTKIIVSRLNNNEFSIINFYLARCKRIIPPLALLCVVLLVFGWFYLLPSEYRNLAKHAAGSISFLSNYLYIREAGYFDVSSHSKWLLHTWSLSVEWQFYLIYPILLSIFSTFSLKYLRYFVVFLAIMSFLCMLYFNNSVSKHLYFSLWGRAWEMACGGIVFLFPLKLKGCISKYLWFLSVISIVVSALLIPKEVLWPSMITIFPILASMMIIWLADNQNFLVRNAMLTWIGKSSYSIYLWHWPIVAYMTVFGISFDLVNIFWGISLAIVLGSLSYYFVEQKLTFKTFNKKYGHSGLFKFIPYIVLSLFVMFLSVSVFVTNGAVNFQRFSPEVINADQQYINHDSRKGKCLVEGKTKSPHCLYGKSNSEQVKLILFGDSHASAIVNAVADTVNNGKVLFIARAGCLTVKDVKRINNTADSCSEFVKNELDYINRNYPNTPLIMVNRWSYYLQGKLGEYHPLVYFKNVDNTQELEQIFTNKLEATVCDLTKYRNVTLLEPIPEYPFSVPNKVARALLNNQTGDITINMDNYFQRNNMALKSLHKVSKICNAKLVKPTSVLCHDQLCYASENKYPLYYDDNHLSEFGNKKLSPLFVQH